MTGELTETQAAAMELVDIMCDPASNEPIRELAMGYVDNIWDGGWPELIGEDIFSGFSNSVLKSKFSEEIDVYFPGTDLTDSVPARLVSLYQSAASASRGYRLLALNRAVKGTKEEFNSDFAYQVEFEWRTATLAKAILTFMSDNG